MRHCEENQERDPDFPELLESRIGVLERWPADGYWPQKKHLRKSCNIPCVTGTADPWDECADSPLGDILTRDIAKLALPGKIPTSAAEFVKSRGFLRDLWS